MKGYRSGALVGVMVATFLVGVLGTWAAAPAGPVPTAARAAGSLAITTRVPGVEVWVDDRRLGLLEAGRELVIPDLSVGRHQVVAKKGARSWERSVEVVATGRSAVAIDLEPGAPPASVTRIAETLARVESSYVEPPDLGVMRVGALRGLERAVPGGAFLVAEGSDSPAVTYQVPGDGTTKLVFGPGSPRDVLVRDLSAALGIARLVAPAGDPVKLETAMLTGALSSLDAHSSFLDPEGYRATQVETSGSFSGVGIEIALRDGALVVVAPIEGTPAWRAGVQAGDRIVRIDGQTTRELGLTDAVRRMRGPKGSRVTISIEREGQPGPLDLTLVRETIQIQSVRAQEIESGFGHVRIRQFQERTAADLEVALERLTRTGRLAGLVLDLRNNPGGLLSAAVEVAEKFLEANRLVVYTQGRGRSQNTRFIAHGRHPATEVPIVVLVSRGSASASEIVAAALQDHGRATVMGQQTFGKGSVQTLIPLSDGAGLRLTTARYFTPRGRSIHGTGVVPDVVLDAPVAESGPRPAGTGGPDDDVLRTDGELRSALAHLRGMIVAKPATPPKRAPQPSRGAPPGFADPSLR